MHVSCLFKKGKLDDKILIPTKLLRCIVFLIKAGGNNLWNNVGNLLKGKC